MKPTYETGMKIVYDAKSKRVVVSFRGRLTVLEGEYASEADGVAAGEQYCRAQGWNDRDKSKSAKIRRAWN